MLKQPPFCADGHASDDRLETYDVAHLAAQAICAVMASDVSTDTAIEALEMAARLLRDIQADTKMERHATTLPEATLNRFK